jgi:conjugative relaxase-like TrwC/TraI family protein
MLSIGRMTAGAGYEYLTREVATSRHDYYTGKGEAAGVWWGDGLGRLGLSGVVATDQMAALYGQAIDPSTGEPLGRRFPIFKPLAERLDAAIEAWTAEHGTPPVGDQLAALRGRLTEAPQRQAIAALDLTFSPVKSVSALWAIADNDMRREIEAAHHGAVTAALTHLQDVAGVTRAGVNGVRTVDAEGWIVARFTHRMSRAKDPQLHTHTAVLNRVYCPQDGRWRTLDSRAIYRLAAGGGGIYTKVLEDELTRRLGVSWVDVDPGRPTPRREIDGIQRDLLRTWSKRRVQVEETLADLDQDARSAKTRAIASQNATLRTRPPKGTPEASPHERWRAEATALGYDAAALAADVAPGRPSPDPSTDPDPAAGPSWAEAEQILDTAVARLEANSATWRRGNLVRAVAEAIPPQARLAGETAALVDQLVARVERSGRLVAIAAPEPIEVPVELQRRDGTSIYRPAAGIRYTTPAVLAAEARIVATARELDPGLSIPSGVVDSVLATGPRPQRSYGPDQTAAVRTLMASGRRLELLIGPAGAGKTTTMRAVVKAWETTGRRVVGLTVAQSAAQVLAEETACTAHNISRWLTTQTARPDDPAWQIRAGDLLLVDEVGMVPTGQLDELRRQAVDAGAKIIGVGDPLQLGPIGAGGAARLVARDVGATYLTELHRFTHPWEATASLLLRSGDPAAASAYNSHARLHAGDRDTAHAAAQRAWLADHLDGRNSLLLTVSRAQVAGMAGWCREQLVDLDLVDDRPGHTVVLRDDNRAGAGDLVVTRRNDRTLGVANRDQWEIEHVAANGSLAVHSTTDRRSVILPADYVTGHVELAYAATIAAAQGRTVDTSHVVCAMGMDRESLYVGLTRGRDANHAYLVTEDFLHEEFGGGSIDAVDALRVIIDQDPNVTSATEALRDELADADSLTAWGPIADDLDTAVTRRATLAYLDHRYGPQTAATVEADPATGALIALVRRSLTVNGQPIEVLARACQGDLDGARSQAQVLAARVRRVIDAIDNGDLDPGELSLRHSWEPRAGAIEHYRDEVAELVEARTHVLGEQAALDQPTWAVEQWGILPDDPMARTVWIDAAGAVAAYRERWQVDATPAELAYAQPARRDIARWQQWQALRRWLDLHDETLASDFEPAAAGNTPRVTSTAAARQQLRDDMATAMADLDAAQTALDAQAGEPDLGVEPDISSPTPDQGPGPGV